MTICRPGKGQLTIQFDAVHKRFPNSATAVRDLSPD
jgi:osmoprotectant transport system ATP-binding protein